MKIFLFIILGILAIATFSVLYNPSEEMDINGIKIDSNDYNSITKPLPNGQFILCSIKDNKCNLMFKRGLK